MATEILYVMNSGDADALDVFCERLRTMTLEPCWGHPRYEDYGRTWYAGNFIEFSSAFRLATTDADVIAKLDALIAANMARPEYQRALAEHEERERRKAADYMKFIGVR